MSRFPLRSSAAIAVGALGIVGLTLAASLNADAGPRHAEHVAYLAPGRPLPSWITWAPLPGALRAEGHFPAGCILFTAETSVIVCPNGVVDTS